MAIMFLRCFFMIWVVLLMTGCPRSSEVHTPAAHAMPARSQQVRQVPAFTRVRIDGAFNVNLHTGYSHPHVVLHGDPRDLAFVSTKVVNGVLRVALSTDLPHYGAVSVDVDSRYLNSFEYHGKGTINGTKLRTGLFDLILDNQGKTTLKGQINLRKADIKGNGYTEISGVTSPYLIMSISGKSVVRLSGVTNLTTLEVNKDGRLSLYWVKSEDLTIRGRGNTFIQLAGVANKLNVELWGSSQFNGRYLRAQRAFIKTHNKSVAEVSAVQHQHTLATETSDIHFYNISELRTDFMGNEGAVLDMRDLGVPYVQEYDQYNK